jgi:hypothetical protein
MIWGKRRFELADYAPYQVRLAKLMLENPSLHSQFIMVSTVTDVPNVFDYYVGVPSRAFPKFESYGMLETAASV